ncbi:hypothetical protein ONE63_009582 [Megalurothrips usitatus]|uniref:Transposable element P transposase-like RNase H domain-containing protein n=1 Tax=Megalurothrips usitatus TaxID=439358 RepID=A0AAV7XP70_9NEOP|nr:hypothetical protein ONE63_009582 [Megalurothrips usitatus]
MYLSAQNNKTVQRTIEFTPCGHVEVFVHCQKISCDTFCENLDPFFALESSTVNNFVDRIVAIVNKVRDVEVCSGFDDGQKYEEVWSSCPYGKIDDNPYQECRYVQTFRSLYCLRIVKKTKWRCTECTKVGPPLIRRAKAAAQEERSKFMAKKFLTREQTLKKLSDLRSELDKTKKKLTRVRERMQEVIKKQGVGVDHDISHDLLELLNSGSITPAQSVFLQQQIKASQLKNACGMRWHPTMVRLALSVHLTSPAAYNLLRETGMVRLPSARTLFDYSHARPIEEGIDRVVLEKLAERVFKMSNEVNSRTRKKENHKIYHVLMGDEMYISQNLIFQKSTGKIIGFTTLDHIDREVKVLEQCIDNYEKECEETMASKVMVYMVKGVSNGVKEVVATFAVGNMSAVQMNVWTWKVIGALERSGIAVVAFVCDGSSINRAFINSHTPADKHPSGIVFSTVNKCARNRKLYFLSDTPHLLKTIRNCFLNARWDKKKSREKRGKTLRKSYKLSPMNVYPDSYARMKVKYAGQVMSKTVSQDLIDQGWPEALETAGFIRRVNDWFDCLNGAHSSVAKKTRNENLAPYEHVDDKRFNVLQNFLDYLDEWSTEANNPNPSGAADASLNITIASNVGGLDESEIDQGGVSQKEETHVSLRQLSKQTLDGIRMTTVAFKPLVGFLLGEGVSFINARVFTQDPLEQHFSKVRAGQGGSTNPNLGQTLKRNRTLEVVGEMGMKRRKGNSGECFSNVEVTEDALPKRQSSRKPKIF